MTKPMTRSSFRRPQTATAVLVLDDGTVYWGYGLGAITTKTGEVVFNTSMTGYQEVMTDPSYAGQIITFTFPHIGNVGVNEEDLESSRPATRGCVFRADITEPANWRAHHHLDSWLKSNGLVAMADVDTRQLTRRIRNHGAPNGTICHNPDGIFELDELIQRAKDWPGLEGMDLAKDVSCHQPHVWSETRWTLEHGYGDTSKSGQTLSHHVVAMDFGAKRNILRCLAETGCQVTVVPATASVDEILNHSPDGIFLSNGPGDPAATGEYAVPVIRHLANTGIPMFGICLGHQLLALALGAKTYKLALGHRGANQPVKDLETGKVEITAQNHGFCVDRSSLPDSVIETHTSLFDGVLEGLKVVDRPIFSVQYHPEASPGPQDSHYLFNRFLDLMTAKQNTAAPHTQT